MWKTIEGSRYLLLPNSEKSSCFGCSPNNPYGLQMEFYTNEDGDLVVSWYSVPERFCGWGDVVHGGVVSTILDEAMGWACITLVRKLLLSKTIEVDFLRPVRSGKEIRVEGSVCEIVNDREAVMQGCIYDDRNEACARAYSIVSLFTLDAARRSGTIDEALLRSFERIVNAGP